jgi:hypothetical protein
VTKKAREFAIGREAGFIAEGFDLGNEIFIIRQMCAEYKIDGLISARQF